MRKSVSSVLLFLVLAAGFLVQSACAYSSSEHGFSVTPPTGWGVNEETGEELVPVLFQDSSVNVTGATINVAVEEASEKSLSELIEPAKQELDSSLGNWQLVSEGSRVIGGLDCYEIVSTWTYSGLDMKSQQVLFLENGKLYAVSCVALQAQYANLVSDFENCLATFEIEEESSQTGTPVDSTLIIIVVVVVVVVATAAVLMLRRKQKPAMAAAGAETT